MSALTSSLIGLVKRKLLCETEVDVRETRSDQDVASRIAKGSRRRVGEGRRVEPLVRWKRFDTWGRPPAPDIDWNLRWSMDADSPGSRAVATDSESPE